MTQDERAQHSLDLAVMRQALADLGLRWDTEKNTFKPYRKTINVLRKIDPSLPMRERQAETYRDFYLASTWLFDKSDKTLPFSAHQLLERLGYDYRGFANATMAALPDPARRLALAA